MRLESQITKGWSERLGYFAMAIMLFLLLTPATGLAQRLEQSRLRNGSAVRKAFRQVVAKARLSTVRVLDGKKDVALGVVVDVSGFVLTKASELKENATCRLTDGREIEAEVVGLHRDYDLAMLKINATDLPAIEWADGDDTAVGSWLATPGLKEDPISVGVVSVARRKIPKQRAVLGIAIAEGKMGPKITQVFPNSGAARAGLKVDDIITGVAGKVIKTREALTSALSAFRPGDTLKLIIRRGDNEKSIQATLGDPVSSLPNRANLQNQLGGRLSRRKAGFDAVLQHDTVLRPQDCGGVIVRLDGKAVGLNIARAGRIESYAIPAAVITTLLSDLKSGKLAPVKEVTAIHDDEPDPPALPEGP